MTSLFSIKYWKQFLPFGVMICATLPAFSMEKENPLIVIETKQTALVYRVDGDEVNCYYFGERMGDYQVFQSLALPAKGPLLGTSRGQNFNEAALRVTHHEGVLSTELKYLKHESMPVAEGVTQTIITLKDKVYDFSVEVRFEAYSNEDIISMSTKLKNQEPGPVLLYDYASGYLPLKAGKYFLTSFHGEWYSEMNMQEEELTRGIKILDSKHGTRSTHKLSPTFILGLDQPATENSGRLVAGTVAWSGNWSLVFEKQVNETLQCFGGINGYGSEWALSPGDSFETPQFLFTYSAQGKGLASRNFHRWARQYGLVNGETLRPTLLNNWEGTYFDFDEKKIEEIIKDGAGIGVEMFVLDDGWFGNKYPRNDDGAGLGDWEVNREKLPNGIDHLVKKTQAHGMKFGIWIEPEMVNPASELYEKYPGWILQEPTRDKYRQRNQYVLDMGQAEVQDFVFGVVDRLLSQHPGISYIKWDANSHFSNVGSTYLPQDKQGFVNIAYTQGLYRVLDRIRAKYPDVLMQVCASGGGRVDYGSLPYFHEFWTSDDTDALQRIFIQWGTSHFFPAIAMAAHVSATPGHLTKRVLPIKFRFDVAMTGRLGIELQPSQMSGEEKEFSKMALKTYKEIVRPVVQLGDLYRLVSPYEHNIASLMYVSPGRDRAILFAYHHHFRFGDMFDNIRLQGLDPSAQYRVRDINTLDPGKEKWSETSYSGEFLMNHGFSVISSWGNTDDPLAIGLFGEYTSEVVEIKRVE